MGIEDQLHSFKVFLYCVRLSDISTCTDTLNVVASDEESSDEEVGAKKDGEEDGEVISITFINSNINDL